MSQVRVQTMVWHGADDAAPGPVAAPLDALAEHYTLHWEPARIADRGYVDTPDLRLHDKGVALVHDRFAGRVARTALTLTPSGGPSTTTPTEVAWPSFAATLDAEIRDRIAELAGIRALLPVTRARVRVRAARVLDDEAKTVVRLVCEKSRTTEPERVDLTPTVAIHGVRGYDTEHDRVVELLTAAGFVADETGPTAAALAATGVLARREAGSAASETMVADQPARTAVATALLRFLDAIESNVDGTVDDIDTEFLHDLRVGVRRTRALLKLAGDALPGRLAARYAPRFKWLGDVTTPNRDLDVHLLGFDGLAAHLRVADPEDLEPFRAHLAKRRATRRRQLVRSLRSVRFSTLLRDWRDALTAALTADDAEGAPTAGELAADRIAEAHRRVVKRAKRISPDASTDTVHDLRKRCKELRYLLEAFGPLHEEAAHRRVVRDLKRVQDSLGDFQDAEVQLTALRSYAEEMETTGTATAACLLAMGELTSTYPDRMRLDDLGERLDSYLGGKTRKHLRDLGGGIS